MRHVPGKRPYFDFAAIFVMSIVVSSLVLYGGVVLAGAAVLAAIFVTILMALPLSRLPAFALILFALVPIQYVPIPTQNGAWSPALIAVGIFGLRAAASGRPIQRGMHVILLVASLIWVVIATILSLNPVASIAWAASFFVLVVVPGLFLPAWPEARQTLESTWINLGGVLGIYGLIEFALRRNMLYGSLYEHATPPLQQSWDVYRITTSLGHPLLNGTFFAIACLLGCGALFRGRRGWTAFSTAVAAGAVILSGSRGAVLALVVGIALMTVVALFKRRVATSRWVVAIFVVGITSIGLIGGSSLNERADSREAAGSTATRLATYEAGRELVVQYFPLGAGPGIADELKRAMPVGDPRRGIESSWLQIAISLGVPGLLTIGSLLVWPALSGLVANVGAAASLIAYVVAVASYNLIEATRPALLLAGVLIGLAIQQSATTTVGRPLLTEHDPDA